MGCWFPRVPNLRTAAQCSDFGGQGRENDSLVLTGPSLPQFPHPGSGNEWGKLVRGSAHSSPLPPLPLFPPPHSHPTSSMSGDPDATQGPALGRPLPLWVSVSSFSETVGRPKTGKVVISDLQTVFASSEVEAWYKLGPGLK